jgi:hypothetical protein
VDLLSQDNANKKVSIEDLEKNRKLDSKGNFTGTWYGYKPSQTNEATTSILDSHEEHLTLHDEQLKDIVTEYSRQNVLCVSPISKYATIESAITYAKANGVSKTNRFLIQVFTGTYVGKHILADGIDIVGIDKNSVIVKYSGVGFRDNDVFFAGFDCKLKNLTIIQDATATTGDMQNYAVHLETEGTTFTCVIENCTLQSIGNFAHHALGAGLHDVQNLILKNVELLSDSKPSLYIHNWHNASPMRVEMDGVKVAGCLTNVSTAYNCGMLVQDVGSGCIEEVIIRNSEIYSGQMNSLQVILEKHPDMTGNRNTVFIRTYSTEMNNFKNDATGGKIITDKDQLSIINGVNQDHYGMPVVLSGYASYYPRMDLNIHENHQGVLGVAVPYITNHAYIRNQGVGDILVDASKGAINVGDYLCASVASAKKATVGSGIAFAQALEPLASGTGLIKAQFISPRSLT